MISTSPATERQTRRRQSGASSTEMTSESTITIRHNGTETIIPVVYGLSTDALVEVVGQMVHAMARSAILTHRRAMGEIERPHPSGVNLGFETECADGDFERARVRAEAIVAG